MAGSEDESFESSTRPFDRVTAREEQHQHERFMTGVRLASSAAYLVIRVFTRPDF